MGLFVLLTALAILILAFSYYCFRICFYSRGESGLIQDHIPEGEEYEPVLDTMLAAAIEMKDAPCEHISIAGHKCTELHGRYYNHCPGAPIMLIFHGYRSVSFRDCAIGYTLAKKLNFNVLAVDQRCHGDSCGHVITFGIHERFDCQLWAKYAAERFPDSPLILSGVSMGAATVLMASSLPLPENVVGIIADCPYASPMAIISKVAIDQGYPKLLVKPLIWLGAWIFGRFNVCTSSALKSAQKAAVPILLIHGEDDHFVPCSMSRAIKEVCPQATLHTFPNAGHGLSYPVDPKRYEQICLQFLRKIPEIKSHLSSV